MDLTPDHWEKILLPRKSALLFTQCRHEGILDVVKVTAHEVAKLYPKMMEKCIQNTGNIHHGKFPEVTHIEIMKKVDQIFWNNLADYFNRKVSQAEHHLEYWSTELEDMETMLANIRGSG